MPPYLLERTLDLKAGGLSLGMGDESVRMQLAQADGLNSC